MVSPYADVSKPKPTSGGFSFCQQHVNPLFSLLNCKHALVSGLRPREGVRMADKVDSENYGDRSDPVARLRGELEEARRQQSATASVLKAMSASASDLDAVFRSVVENSVVLCGADRAIIFRFDGQVLRAAAAFNTA